MRPIVNRKSTIINRIEYIDFAKGYAIFTIVCYHALQRLPLSPLLHKAIGFGGTGVHLFFLLSGFGLALSSGALALGAFYRRRLSKVWLPYALALGLSLLAALTLGLFSDGWAAWFAGIGLYQMFWEPYILSFGGHFWFISAIIQFYAVFPLLVWAQQKIGRPNRFIGLALLISIGWWLLVYTLGKGNLRTWNSFFLQFLWEFALGMVLAQQLARRSKEESAWGKWLPPSPENPPTLRWLAATLAIGVAGTGAMIFLVLKLGEVGKIFNDLPALIGYTAFSLFLYGVGLRFFPPLRRFFLWVSGFSYSLYLVHVLVLELFLHFVATQPGYALSYIGILPYLPLALLAARAFEPLAQYCTNLLTPKL